MKYDNNKFLEYLDSNKIEYKFYTHQSLSTVSDSKKLRGNIDGAHTKNLFLKDKKNHFFLLSCLEDKIIDLKMLREPLKAKNLSFASELYLKEILNIKPGSVSPFGLINDSQKKTKFFMDIDILSNDSVNFHPLVNSITINLKTSDFINFLKIINARLLLINLKVYKLIQNYGSDS